jgi:outer membrane murein-binding lipoprotein Lpp
MTSTSLRALMTGALMLSISVATAFAQAAEGTILNAVEVQRLVSRAELGDHARLGAHFGALADTYDADAKRHAAMAQRYAGNPNRDVSGLAAHCRQLASLNRELASSVRELAAHHRTLGAGVPSVRPQVDAAFDAGKGARTPTGEEVLALAGTARTAADHTALAEHFLTLARRYGTDADNHAALARACRAPRTGHAAAAAHCERLETLSRSAAKEASDAAAMHRQAASADAVR